jgi:two-component system sporulation sensor kinase A/two-component system, sporulation sensor kinase E
VNRTQITPLSKKRVKLPKSLKYFLTLGFSFAILAYLGNAVFQTEKTNVIHQHLLQSRLLAHIGAVSIAYSLEEIQNAQQLVLAFTEKKKHWEIHEIKPLISSFVKANNIVKWAGISTAKGKIIYQYPVRLPLPPDFKLPLPEDFKQSPRSSPIKFLLKSQMFLFSHKIKKAGGPKYFIWYIGSTANFNRSFLNTYRKFNCKYLWLVLQGKTKRTAFYIGPDFKQSVTDFAFSLPFDYREISFKGEKLLAGAHPVHTGPLNGWFVVGIPKDQIEIQLAQFRYQGVLLTGFFVVFISIFLFTYFKNRSRRIVAEQTANISREILISKQQLESYLENSSDGILRNDINGKIRYVNPAFAKMFGWEVKDVIGKNILDIFPDDKKRITKVMETIKRKKAFPPYDTKRRRKDGQIINLYVSASPILNSRGNVIAITAVYRDHTKLKRLEGRLHQSEKMAAIGQLVAQIAHEINNPLSTLQLSLQILRRAIPDNPELTEEIEDMDEEIRRIAGIVNQLLSFSRPQSQRKRQASLKRVVKNKMIQLLFKNLHENGIEVELDIGSPLPLVSVYSDQMLQVFLNLIKNAADSIENQGKITIHITTKILEPDTSYSFPSGDELAFPRGKVVEITVSDTGKGIPSEALPHIFEPFYSSKGKGGTGLGLSVVHNIIAKAGGSIEVESTPGKGTTFFITLPAIASRQSHGTDGKNMLK